MSRIRRHLTVASVIAVIGASASLVASAAANTIRYPTSIDQQAVWSGPDMPVFFAGNVHSPRRACIANRKVKMVVHYTDGSTQLLDTDLTSKHGAWSGGGRFRSGDVDRAVAKVLRKRISRDPRRICKAASTPLGA